LIKNESAPMNDLFDSVRITADIVGCEECGSTSRIARGLCLNCLLHRAFDSNPGNAQTLYEALNEVDLRDADWRLGNYQILEEIGRGGMGVIYRARQRHSRRIVALKRILAYQADSQETLARFRREAEAAASLDHPNILPIYEVSESEDGLPFFSMKFAAGGSLVEAAPALGNEPRRSVALMAKVARAVQYAHVQGILHRDLKPGNILLDGGGEPLVSDFGLAKWLDTSSDLTRTLTIFGTPGYIAPEQAKRSAANLSPAADVYSLGAILFDLFTGRPPFLGEHALAVIHQASEKPAPKLHTLIPGFDRDLETICAKCLEREPVARYRSAGELAEDLERWLEGRPIIARPVSLPVRIWRWSKRNPKLAGSVAVCSLAIAAAAVWQIQSRNLAATVREEQLTAHSIAVLPFLDLDTGGPDFESANLLTQALRLVFESLGPARIVSAPELPPKWTGSGSENEVGWLAGKTPSRAVLYGTRRRIPGGARFSMHLLNADTSEILQTWITETSGSQTLSQKLAAAAINPAIYRALDQAKATHSSATPDPVMENERARPYMLKGEELLYRRTIPDMDRAIVCFEGAIKAEPRSIAARCYLAFALMGRDLLSTTPELALRALKAAYDAVKLAPADPTASRSVCAVATSIGNYPEAFEYGFRALELGDQSERVFGEIGYIWKMIGRPDRALIWFEKVRLTHRQPAECDALIGDCWADLLDDARSKEAYESAAAFMPDQADGWIGLCRLKLLAKDYIGAREICRRELPKYPQSQNALRMAALIEFFARNIPEAEKRYRELAQNDPLGGIKGGFYGAVDYRSALACLQILAGRGDETRPLLVSCLDAEEKRLADVPTDLLARYRKAALEAMLGDSVKALADLRSAFEAGWMDYRTTAADPRFDKIAASPEFRTLIADAARKVEMLAQKGDLRNL
jgi:serine/threonine protein kinase/tetratricopeptide (TPR) repeat protein